MTWDKDFTCFSKIHSEFITDWSVKCKAIKLKDSLGENSELAYGNDFLDTALEEWFMKKIDWLDFIKLKMPALWKKMSRECQDNQRMRENIFKRYIW